MPNRILREGIVTSPRIALLAWPAEVFYRRLMSVVDDFGRYHAHPMLLRAACYPMQLDKVSDSDVGKWLAETRKAALVRVYESSGAAYLELLDFRQQVRAKKSKFPDPPAVDMQMLCECAADDKQVIANAHLDVDVFEDDTPRSKRGARALPADWVPSSKTVETLSREFGLRVPEDIDRYVAAFTDYCKAKGKRYSDFDAAFRNCVRQDWPKFRNGRATNDRGFAHG